MSFNLKLPDERGKQLQLIAENEGKTVVDVITDFIRSKVAAGVIPADLPFADTKKTPDGVAVVLPGFSGEVPVQEVPALADVLRDAAEKLTPADIERKHRLIEGMAALTGIKVKRMAQGVKLISPITGQEYPLAFGVAADLADQIERAAE
ncbi:hypothetical protein [Pseudogemmobacter faecipullorum]|uniref:Uncharacterized protein n=1 Tax=Pseudogemmobacter faecipullorum TaxID=2755041 RepID=A0ABS8CR89_9RHOB|nr:hypothetical protein [Pseudogemmobacter faecipullorum]MCB5411888.1 hypothetical protein [Pseudogemmobacter faecipullorum]